MVVCFVGSCSIAVSFVGGWLNGCLIRLCLAKWVFDSLVVG